MYDFLCSCQLFSASLSKENRSDGILYACCHCRYLSDIILSDGMQNLPAHLNAEVLNAKYMGFYFFYINFKV